MTDVARRTALLHTTPKFAVYSAQRYAFRHRPLLLWKGSYGIGTEVAAAESPQEPAGRAPRPNGYRFWPRGPEYQIKPGAKSPEPDTTARANSPAVSSR